jgi:ATP-dependent DNA helicase DinG
MATAVAAIAAGYHLVVEAGTGVGKSLAYAVPAILAALESGDKVVISTHTKALQQQLIGDLKFLRSVIPKPFKVALVKGRRNYLSRRRLDVALAEWHAVFPDMVQKDAVDQLKRIRDWSQQEPDGSERDHDGSRDVLDFRPLSVV